MKIIVLPDSHDKPGISKERYRWLGNMIVDQKPDVVVDLGDFADMHSLSSYDKGTGSFEGRRLKHDFESAQEARYTLMEPILKLQERQRRNKEKIYKPRLIQTEGNHESVHYLTEVLTEKGWLKASELTMFTKLASVNLNTGILSYDYPVALSMTMNSPAYELKSNLVHEIISDRHRIIYNNKPVEIENIENINQTYYNFGGTLDNQWDFKDKNLLRLLVWTICDGTIVVGPGIKARVQFKLSRQDKIEKLKKLLDTMQIKYSFKPCKKYGENVLQPYYIRFYSDWARKVLSFIPEKKIPKNWSQLNKDSLDIILETALETDAHKKDNSIRWRSISKENLEIIQLLCIHNNIPCKIGLIKNSSGFPNGKQQYHLTICNNGVWTNTVEKVKIENKITVVSITTKDDTIITRNAGKVVLTGNSRLKRAMNNSPELQDMFDTDISGAKQYGWELHPFLDIVEVEGICFSHYFTSGVMGRPIGGEHPAYSLVTKMHKSCIAGHLHLFDYCERANAACGRIQSMIAGCYFEHEENYAGPANRMWRRGITVLKNVHNGTYDFEFYGIDRMRNLYGE